MPRPKISRPDLKNAAGGLSIEPVTSGGDQLFDSLTKGLNTDPLLAALGQAFDAAGSPDSIVAARKRLRDYVVFLERLLTVVESATGIPVGDPLLGGSGISGGSARSLPVGDRGSAPVSLAPREFEVARRVAAGVGVPTTAQELGVSPHTVRNQLKSVFRKLGIHSQLELVSVAMRHGWITHT